MKAFSSEVALARPLVEWLSADGWTVYQEVHHAGATCDVVATRGPLVWAIETKLQFGTAVLEQAHRWTGLANLVSVATPFSRPSWVLRDFCKRHGIGWLIISSPGSYRPTDEDIAPRLARIPHESRPLRKALHPSQLTGPPAGSNGGGYHTPFKNTCRLVAERVQAKPGITMKELMTGLDHHYATSASARSGIAHWASKGAIPGVVVKHEGRALKLYPLEAGEDARVAARKERLAREGGAA